ncbi:hypothetical protein RJ641_031405 [Dillenia turbinata]|uniref:Uncharacterized protein n=1 Tax=Dillenia turbinata TaxID=194707 RepID=A0AAN8VY27_9MAGN
MYNMDSNDHTLKLRSEDDLTSKPRMLVQNPGPRIPLEHVLLIIGRRRKLFKPFLSDVDLALCGTSVDLFQSVGGRIDQAVVD